MMKIDNVNWNFLKPIMAFEGFGRNQNNKFVKDPKGPVKGLRILDGEN